MELEAAHQERVRDLHKRLQAEHLLRCARRPLLVAEAGLLVAGPAVIASERPGAGVSAPTAALVQPGNVSGPDVEPCR